MRAHRYIHNIGVYGLRIYPLHPREAVRIYRIIRGPLRAAEIEEILYLRLQRAGIVAGAAAHGYFLGYHICLSALKGNNKGLAVHAVPGIGVQSLAVKVAVQRPHCGYGMSMRVKSALWRIAALLQHLMYGLHYAKVYIGIGKGVRGVKINKVHSRACQHLQLLAYHPFVVGIIIAPKRLAPPVSLTVGRYLLVILMIQNVCAVFSFKYLGGVPNAACIRLPDPHPEKAAHLLAVVLVAYIAVLQHKQEFSLGYMQVRSCRVSADDLFHALTTCQKSAPRLVVMPIIKQRADGFRTDVFSALVYARVVAPLSKHQTFHDILPKLYVQKNFSYDQLLEGLEFMGEEYEKLVEILTVATDDNFILDSSRSYFDCTNYYFEIDKESTLQKRGPSKENRRDPIVGMGLLLDAQMLPVGMKIFPGNESEKPVMRDLIHDLKSRNNIKGRTIQIADKGLNCAKNIIEAIDNGDGYLFSKSVKTLPERERQWVLLDDGFETVFDQNGEPVYKIKECIDTFTYSYKDDYGNVITRNIKEKRTVTYNFSLAKKKLMEINRMIEKAKAHRACQAKKEEYGESSKYMQFLDDQGKSIKPQLNQKAIDKDKELAGYNMLVTSEINMSSKDIYNAYHQLWQIEESFRIMKSELDTRPVYLQKENRIKGHFFICYTAVLLSRILQFKILENKYSASTIYDFMRKFRVVRINSTRFINLLTSKEFVTDLSKKLNQPITNYYLTDKQIKMMHTR